MFVAGRGRVASKRWGGGGGPDAPWLGTGSLLKKLRVGMEVPTGRVWPPTKASCVRRLMSYRRERSYQAWRSSRGMGHWDTAISFSMVGSRPLRNVMTLTAASDAPAMLMSSWKSTMYSLTAFLPWYYPPDTSVVSATARSFSGQNSSSKCFRKARREGKGNVPSSVSVRRRHWAKTAARPDFMYDRIHCIFSSSSRNSDLRRVKYSWHEVRKARPFARSPSKHSGVATFGLEVVGRGGTGGGGGGYEYMGVAMVFAFCCTLTDILAVSSVIAFKIETCCC